MFNGGRKCHHDSLTNPTFLEAKSPLLILPHIPPLLHLFDVACKKGYDAFVFDQLLSPSQLKGCAYSNIAGLLGAMLAFCVYVVSIVTLEPEPERCAPFHDQPWNTTGCPSDYLEVSVFHMCVFKCVFV